MSNGEVENGKTVPGLSQCPRIFGLVFWDGGTKLISCHFTVSYVSFLKW
jgi:hypothetical protein